MNKRLLYFLLSILCLVIGVGIYYFFKKDILVYESYIGLKKTNMEGYSFANWLPDLCWEISFLFMLSAVWGNWRLVPNSIKLLAFSLIIGTELVQMLGWLPGTGDIKDILVYFIGFSIFTLLFLIKRTNRTYEKLD
jgi:hypothetical protein